MIRLPVSHAERKVRGGKLLRVSVDRQADLIRSVKITGDFFIHPEEDLEKLEEAARGLPLNRPDKLEEAFHRVVRENGTQILGFSIEDLTELMREAR